MSQFAAKTGLSEAQVYKWGWDQKKRNIAKFNFKFHFFN